MNRIVINQSLNGNSGKSLSKKPDSQYMSSQRFELGEMSGFEPNVADFDPLDLNSFHLTNNIGVDLSHGAVGVRVQAPLVRSLSGPTE